MANKFVGKMSLIHYQFEMYSVKLVVFLACFFRVSANVNVSTLEVVHVVINGVNRLFKNLCSKILYDELGWKRCLLENTKYGFWNLDIGFSVVRWSKMLTRRSYDFQMMLSSITDVFLAVLGWFVFQKIFRHGEKNPDIKFTYPNDPYKNETFYPFSQGQLNLEGRKTMYALGHILHKRYRDFLGEIYSHKMIEAWASPFPRNIFSMQIVMASLFPPSEVERWNDKLNWQPTLYHYTNWEDDKLFRILFDKEYVSYYWKVCKTDRSMQSALEKYKPWLKYIEDHSGFGNDCARNAYILNSVLTAEHEANLKLPDWSKKIFPKILNELTEIEYQHQIHTRQLKRMIIGNFLQKILNDTQNRLYKKSEKKFYLYSGHEINIIHILSVLEFMYPHTPSYGASLAIEVHKIEEDRHILMIIYRDNKHGKLQPLKNIQGRDYLVLEKYREIVDDIFADDDGSITNSASSYSEVNFFVTFSSLVSLLCSLSILT